MAAGAAIRDGSERRQYNRERTVKTGAPGTRDKAQEAVVVPSIMLATAILLYLTLLFMRSCHL